MSERLDGLKQRLGQLSDLSHALSLAHWDQQTMMPPRGGEARAESLATLHLTKQITLEVALQRSSNPDELQEIINRGASLAGRSSTGVAARGTATGKH